MSCLYFCCALSYFCLQVTLVVPLLFVLHILHLQFSFYSSFLLQFYLWIFRALLRSNLYFILQFFDCRFLQILLFDYHFIKHFLHCHFHFHSSFLLNSSKFSLLLTRSTNLLNLILFVFDYLPHLNLNYFDYPRFIHFQFLINYQEMLLKYH